MSNRLIQRGRLISLTESAFSEGRFVRIGAPRGSGGDELVRQIVSHFADDPSLLLIENLESLDSSTAKQKIEEARAAAAAGQKVVLTSSLPLTNLFAEARVAGEVTEIGMDALALNEDEVRDFLGSELAECFSATELHGLLARTEGWIGSWQLVRLLLLEGSPPDELARQFDGWNKDLAAFFELQILAGMDSDAVDFLIATAPLPRLSSAICDLAADRADSEAALEKVAASCGFLVPEANGRYQWRVHAVFRDYLKYRARRDSEARYRTVARNAANFAASQNDWLNAAKLYEEAGLTDLSVDVLRKHGDELLAGRGEIAGFRQAVASLPLPADGPQPLALEMALSSLFSGNVAGSAALAEQAATRLGNEAIGEVHSRIAAIRICINFGLEHFNQVRDAAGAWLTSGQSVDPNYRALVALAASWSCHTLLDERGFVSMRSEARRALAATTSAFLSTWCDLIDSMHGLTRGDLGRAAELGNQAASTGVIRSTTNLLRATLAYERNDIATASHLLTGSLDEGLRHSIVESSLLGWETALRIAAIEHGMGAMLSTAHRAETLMALRHGERARRMIRLARARAILRSAAPHDGPALAIELRSLAEDEIARHLPPSFKQSAQLTLARFHVRYGDPRSAVTLVQPVRHSAGVRGDVAAWAEATMIYGGALARLDDPSRGSRMAWEAVSRLSELGFKRSIIDEALLLAPILEQLVHRAAERLDDPAAPVLNEIAALSGKIIQADDPVNSLEMTGVRSSLTENEKRVLRLVANGLSNIRIAEKMGVKLTTVKFHLSNIFTKFDVHSRTAALAVASRLGIDL